MAVELAGTKTLYAEALDKVAELEEALNDAKSLVVKEAKAKKPAKKTKK